MLFPTSDKAVMILDGSDAEFDRRKKKRLWMPKNALAKERHWLSELPATALMPPAATSTVVPTTVAPTLTVVETTLTAASATVITAQPLQSRARKRERKQVRMDECRDRWVVRILMSCVKLVNKPQKQAAQNEKSQSEDWLFKLWWAVSGSNTRPTD